MSWRLACIGVCAFGACAAAQIAPQRGYFGVNRPIPMEVTIPEGISGEARIDLFAPDGTSPVATAPVAPGAVNLASLFPSLWADKSPRVLYAQLSVGETRIGPPVVLRPLTNPGIPMLWSQEAQKPFFVDPVTGQPSIDPRKGQIVVTPDPPAYSGLAAYIDQHVVFDTSLGTIEFRLRPDHAPNTVRNFMQLVREGFYTDIVFHRVVPRTPAGDPFVIQVGDPTGEGSGGPGYAIDLEVSSLKHDFGVLSMARDNDPNTNGSQVFVCLSREGTARLDGKYTSFAQAVSGAEAITSIGATEVKGDRPVEPPVLRSARLIDAPPFGTGPKALERPITVRPESR